MFSLGVYDKLTEGELTGGKSIAGNRTISDNGTVGPINGIRQKMAGARQAGAGLLARRSFQTPPARPPKG